MTQNRNLKRRVRARAAKTGESYTAALRQVRRAMPDQLPPTNRSVRLAVAQTTLFTDPRDASGLRARGMELRHLMRQAREGGARLVHFPEGATCWPDKHIMSETGPRDVGPSDWTRFEWDVLGEELRLISDLARELALWTVFGSVHRLTPPHRPHNSLYVVSDRGELVTRYDERLLSKTKVSFMYAAGRMPVVFEVDGVRFGCALGMEAHYPEIFMEYDRLDVDCVLFSTSGESPTSAPAFAAEVLGHAASNAYWVSYSAHAPQSVAAPSGIAAQDGRWAARCPVDGTPAIVMADIRTEPDRRARSWRQTIRGDPYRPHQVDGDSRSSNRKAF